MTVQATRTEESSNQRLGKVLLLDLEERQLSIWAEAGTADGVLCLAVRDVTACEGHALGETPTVVVTGSDAFRPRMADPGDPAFSRTALVVLTDDTKGLPLWNWVGWAANASNLQTSEAVSILAEAIPEAAQRRAESEMLLDFRRRRATLTENEELAFAAICAGRLNKQIANDFGVSVRTVEQRRRRLFEKMGVESAVPLAALSAKVDGLEDRIRRHRRRASTERSTLAAPIVPAPKYSQVAQQNGAHDSGLIG